MSTTTLVGRRTQRSTVRIQTGFVELVGELEMPEHAPGVVIFAHGGGSSRFSPRNQHVAEAIREAGIGTLLFDMLNWKEQQEDAVTQGLRFDVDLLAQRLIGVTCWLGRQPATRGLKVGCFGSCTGGAAALMAAAAFGDRMAAVVCRGGRADLAGKLLRQVSSPTLLIVGGCDLMTLALNQEAYDKLCCEKDLRIVDCATHLFAEPGKLEQVAQISANWFAHHMGILDGLEGA